MSGPASTAVENGPPKTELQELQIKAQQTTDEVNVLLWNTSLILNDLY